MFKIIFLFLDMGAGSLQGRQVSGDLPTTTTWPKPLWAPTAVQFHRWCLNCSWHSVNPSLAPLLMATIASGLVEHIRRWRAVSPGIRLQMRSALNAITVETDLTQKRSMTWRWIVDRIRSWRCCFLFHFLSFLFCVNSGGTWPQHLRLHSAIACFPS